MEQINAITKYPYQNTNQEALQEAGSKYNSNEWLTFLQAKELKRKVKKGEKGIRLVKIVESDDELSRETYPRYFTVFNLEQTEEI